MSARRLPQQFRLTIDLIRPEESGFSRNSAVASAAGRDRHVRPAGGGKRMSAIAAVLVRLEGPGQSVDLYLPVVPRGGEHVNWKGEDHIVERVIHVVSRHPFHVRVVLSP